MMFLDLFLKYIFQPLYDGWYRLTGNTQFGLSRGSLISAWMCWILAVVFYRHSIPLYLAIVYVAVLFGLTCWLTALWLESESGWDHRVRDTRGDAYRSLWPWGTLRASAALVGCLELYLATTANVVPTRNAHLLYALMSFALMCGLFFSACNRTYFQNKQVSA